MISIPLLCQLQCASVAIEICHIEPFGIFANLIEKKFFSFALGILCERELSSYFSQSFEDIMHFELLPKFSTDFLHAFWSFILLGLI